MSGPSHTTFSLAAHPWPGAAAVRARMGLHTGEPMRFGTTYVGLDVHHAARLCAAGHGSQILISQTTRAQIERVLPPEMRLVSLGLHCLKDLDPPETISQLLAPGLTAHFPPLRTPAAQTTAQDRRDIEQRETGQDPAFQNHVRPITGRAA